MSTKRLYELKSYASKQSRVNGFFNTFYIILICIFINLDIHNNIIILNNYVNICIKIIQIYIYHYYYTY